MNKFLILGVTGLLVLVAGFFLFTNKANKQVTAPTVTEESPTPLSSPSAQLEERKVNVTKTGFEPNTLKIKVGTKVVWENKSGDTVAVNSIPHPIHNLYPILNLGSFEDGSSVRVTFTEAGTYIYHNHLNSAQTGTVIVE